jgi:hypothetical protein
VEQRILLKGLSHVGATLTFQDWVAHWSLFAANDPVATQVHTVVFSSCFDENVMRWRRVWCESCFVFVVMHALFLNLIATFY